MVKHRKLAGDDTQDWVELDPDTIEVPAGGMVTTACGIPIDIDSPDDEDGDDWEEV